MNSASILQNLPQWLQATVLVLGVLSTLATAVAGCFALLAKLFPGVAFFDSAAKAVAVAGVDLAAVGSWLGGVVGAKRADAQRGFASAHALLLVLCAGIVLSTLSIVNGCAWWQHGGEAVVVTEAEKIVAEALEGKTVEQIAIDLGIDVAEVIGALLKAGQEVKHTKAYGEALKTRATLLALPAPDGGA